MICFRETTRFVIPPRRQDNAGERMVVVPFHSPNLNEDNTFEKRKKTQKKKPETIFGTETSTTRATLIRRQRG